jgi:hypothetical protein
LREDQWNIGQRFDVVDNRWLSKESHMNGKRWFIAWFAALAFDRVEQRRFFTADVCSCAAANFNIE